MPDNFINQLITGPANEMESNFLTPDELETKWYKLRKLIISGILKTALPAALTPLHHSLPSLTLPEPAIALEAPAQ